jgi:malonyl-CoA/methylmalonyl-CoA synthetase
MNNQNLYLRLVGKRFLNAGDHPFLITPGRTPLLYAELDGAVGRIASRLLELGVMPGDRVMVQAPKSPESVLLYLACLRTGAIYIPLNTAYTAAEIGYFIGDAEPRLFVCQSTNLDTLLNISLAYGVPHVRTVNSDGSGDLFQGYEQLNANPAVVARDQDDLAAILYTSGTTGRPKGAMLSHDNLRSNAEILHQFWHWDDQKDVLLHALPVFHVHGLFVAFHCALLGASPVHFLPKFSLDLVIERLSKCTVMMGVPTFYTRLLTDERLTSELCRNMRLFISGSAPLLAETHREFQSRTGFRILERYGMTEAGMITSNPYDGERVAGTVGFALPGVSVRIADNKGRELPRGETGSLELKGRNVFKGYWRMPDKTAAEFRQDGWFISGDNAVMDAEGRISIVGRAKDLIISGGFNIYPKEIEAEIDAIPGVKESAVVGAPHPDFGEGALAVVVSDDTCELSEADIIESLQGRLARFKQPKRVVFIDELPRNTMGKVQKSELRETYKDCFQS